MFGGPRADTQLLGDAFGREPLQEKGEDLSLPLCQPRLPGVESPDFVWIAASYVGPRQGLLDGDQQRLGVERLFDKMKGACLHGRDSRGNVAVAGYHDDGRFSRGSDDMLEQVNP